MGMKDFFETARKAIRTRVEGFLGEVGKDLGRVSPWGTDAVSRLAAFATGGKMLRGGLVVLGHDLCGSPRPEDAVNAAAAMELFQSSFLVHDDIMDRDQVRRGRPSVYSQFAESGRQLQVLDDYHFGESMGICAGDIAFFMAFELLGRLRLSGDDLGALLRMAARELSYVGAAQMEDVYFGSSAEEPTEERIVGVFRYKTGRYTFSLPLQLGLEIGGGGRRVRDLLSGLGEDLGILFQIRDDELGLLADEAELGKPLGSDVAENKKTLHRLYLFQAASPAEAARLRGIFGAPLRDRRDFEFVVDLMRDRGVFNRVETMVRTKAAAVEAKIRDLPIDAAWRDLLLELLAYNLSRRR